MCRHLIVSLWAAAGASAPGQILTNTGFETGGLEPWAITQWYPSFPCGEMLAPEIVPFDIDGPGPLGTSAAAKFVVGAPPQFCNYNGLLVRQAALLTAGVTYTLRLNYAVERLPGSGPGTARFTLLVDDQELLTAVGPVLAGQTVYGLLADDYTPALTGVHHIGFRIWRDHDPDPLARQYVDRFTAHALCGADCNGDGAITIADLGCFQMRFVLQDAYADCNADYTLNVADFGCFQTRFIAGCP